MQEGCLAKLHVWAGHNWQLRPEALRKDDRVHQELARPKLCDREDYVKEDQKVRKQEEQLNQQETLEAKNEIQAQRIWVERTKAVS